MKRHALLIAVLLISASVLAGCSHYAVIANQDATRVWVYKTKAPGDPVLFECCDSCGKNSQPICWKAMMLGKPGGHSLQLRTPTISNSTEQSTQDQQDE